MVPENWTLSVYQQKWHAIPEISVKAGVNRNSAFVNSCIFAVHPCSADTRGFLEHTHIKHIQLTSEMSSGRKSCSPGSNHTHSKLGHLLGPVDEEKLSLLQPEKTADVEPQRPPQTMEKRLRRRSGHHQRDKTRWQTLVRDISGPKRLSSGRWDVGHYSLIIRCKRTRNANESQRPREKWREWNSGEREMGRDRVLKKDNKLKEKLPFFPTPSPPHSFLALVSLVGIIFYPPKPHRSRGTEIEFWTPCDMLYQSKMPAISFDVFASRGFAFLLLWALLYLGDSVLANKGWI